MDKKEKSAELVRSIIRFLYNNVCTVSEANKVLVATQAHITHMALEKTMEDTSADINEQFKNLYL